MNPRSRKNIQVAIFLGATFVLLFGLAAWVGVSRDRTGPDSRTVMILGLETTGEFNPSGAIGLAFARAVAINLEGIPKTRILPVPAGPPPGDRGVPAVNRAARRAGAGLLIRGRLERRGKSILAGLFLIHTTRNQVLWGSQRKVADQDLSRLAAAFARDIARSQELPFPKQFPEWTHLGGATAGPASGDFFLAGEALRRGDLEAALEATRQLLKTRSREPLVWVLRARALARVWQTDRSPGNRRDLETALGELDRIDPINPYTARIRAGILDAEGRTLEAISRYTLLLDREDLSPAFRAAIRVRRAECDTRIGDREGTRIDLREALRQDPLNTVALSLESRRLLVEGDRQGSLERARQAFDLDPFGFRSNHAVALVLMDAGNWKDAVPHSTTACELGRNQATCGLHAVLLRKSGREKDAESAARRAGLMLETDRGMAYLAMYRLLGKDRIGALDWLRRSLELGLNDVNLIRHSGFLSLNGDPEFDEMVGKVIDRAAEN